MFKLTSQYQPSGDQPQAIEQLVEGIRNGERYQTLLGVTGSGKTFTVSNVIQQIGRPTMVISHNKTLAAQLYGELKRFFPENRVEYFISYYDYYQPEAYIPRTDTYIEKDFSINDEIDRLRLRATTALLEDREDIIVVSSVSCIYGLGTKESFKESLFLLRNGLQITRRDLLYRLSEIHYSRNDVDFHRGTFRVRGDVIDVVPGGEEDRAIRIEMFGDEIDRISWIDRVTGTVEERVESVVLYPAKIFVTSSEETNRAIVAIENELRERLTELQKEDKYLESQRLEQRTMYDLEMMREVGYCSGIENYSMHLSGRKLGERPICFLDYFPEDYLMIIDESHVTIPQLRAMYNGDRVRKNTLVEHGFRLPSAMENRPQKFEEFESQPNQTIFVSATPADYELEMSNGVVVEQVIRPTGLLDPEIEVRPIATQVDDLLEEVRIRKGKKERVLVTTLTKRMAEDLTDYLSNLRIKAAYIHSDLDALERVEVLRDFRIGEYDVIVGVNLLREGLDMPEVTLVGILDADKEGFLRSDKALLQTAGRTARNAKGKVILYADKITRSMQVLIDETNRRRKLQIAYNEKHGINPTTVYKSVEEILQSTAVADVQTDRKAKRAKRETEKLRKAADPMLKYLTDEQRHEMVKQMTEEMKTAALELDFEKAAELRDEIAYIQTLSSPPST